MIRILHLSYCESKTGAGIAAKRIHDCIRNYNDPEIKSLLRVNTFKSNNQNIINTKKSTTNIIVIIERNLCYLVQ